MHRQNFFGNFMLAVIWQVELEACIRALGIRTDVEVEGPRRSDHG
ncbi:hypothetical protein [Pseudodesulfovibrio karagichevae]|uniref:Uncharacterized protein n=1 Tax=Pseudodesulfovibrio karagichevae TaxID=3239305 RepID=A0ABV4K4W2_9BACT